jgi:hypothetical protein
MLIRIDFGLKVSVRSYSLILKNKYNSWELFSLFYLKTKEIVDPNTLLQMLNFDIYIYKHTTFIEGEREREKGS